MGGVSEYLSTREIEVSGGDTLLRPVSLLSNNLMFSKRERGEEREGRRERERRCGG